MSKVNSNKRGSPEGIAHAVRRRVKAKQRVANKDYDDNNSPATTSSVQRYVRGIARKTRQSREADAAYEKALEKARADQKKKKAKKKKPKKGVRSLGSPSDTRDDKHIMGQMMRDHRAAVERAKAKQKAKKKNS